VRYSSRRIGILFLAGIAIVAFGALAVACGEDEADENANGGETPVLDITPSASFAEACRKSDEKQFTEPPPQIIDTNKTYIATIKTAKGDMVVELYSDVPITTNNFVFLACKGFYDGLTFHRVVADFVIQGGDPTGQGSGGPGYKILEEDDGDHLLEEGVISMAHTDQPNSTGSQFFITIGLGADGSLEYLDPDFAVFGSVTEGMDVAKQIAQGDVMEAVTIEER